MNALLSVSDKTGIVELAQADLGQPKSSVLFSDWKLRSGSPASA